MCDDFDFEVFRLLWPAAETVFLQVFHPLLAGALNFISRFGERVWRNRRHEALVDRCHALILGQLIEDL